MSNLFPLLLYRKNEEDFVEGLKRWGSITSPILPPTRSHHPGNPHGITRAVDFSADGRLAMDLVEL